MSRVWPRTAFSQPRTMAARVSFHSGLVKAMPTQVTRPPESAVWTRPSKESAMIQRAALRAGEFEAREGASITANGRCQVTSNGHHSHQDSQEPFRSDHKHLLVVGCSTKE